MWVLVHRVWVLLLCLVAIRDVNAPAPISSRLIRLCIQVLQSWLVLVIRVVLLLAGFIGVFELAIASPLWTFLLITFGP